MGFDGALPVMPPVAPMLAKGSDRIPDGPFIHEPKWDGFRALFFRDGAALWVQSRDGRPLLRYFPEIADPVLQALPERCVADGELVLPGPDGLDFGRLQLRLHPAASRVRKLAEEMPASIVLFDLLAVGDEDLMGVGFGERRARLLQAVGPAHRVHVTPATEDPAVAADWFARFEGAGLDGVVSKDPASPYSPGKRTMVKTKRQRTVDAVLCGFRWHKDGAGVGSLVLGLYAPNGDLVPIGVASSFTAKQRKALAAELEPYRSGTEGHPWAGWTNADGDGMKSRWNAERDLSWEPVRIERVVEISCNQVTGGRLRHPAHLVRWRDDRDPASCGTDQLVVPPAAELAELLT